MRNLLPDKIAAKSRRTLQQLTPVTVNTWRYVWEGGALRL